MANPYLWGKEDYPCHVFCILARVIYSRANNQSSEIIFIQTSEVHCFSYPPYRSHGHFLIEVIQQRSVEFTTHVYSQLEHCFLYSHRVLQIRNIFPKSNKQVHLLLSWNNTMQKCLLCSAEGDTKQKTFNVNS